MPGLKKKFQFLYYWEFLEISNGISIKNPVISINFFGCGAVIPIMEDPLYQRSHTSSTCQCILIIMRMFMCVLAVYIVLENSFQYQIFMLLRRCISIHLRGHQRSNRREKIYEIFSNQPTNFLLGVYKIKLARFFNQNSWRRGFFSKRFFF